MRGIVAGFCVLVCACEKPKAPDETPSVPLAPAAAVVPVAEPSVPVAVESVSLATDAPKATPKELAAAARSLNQFGAKAYSHLATGSHNMVVSTESLGVVLSMLAVGASGASSDRLAHALAFALPPARQHQALGDLGRRLSKFNRPRLTVASANALFGNRRQAFRPEFLADLRAAYDSELSLLDFADSDNAAKVVNQWIATHTHGRIQNAVSPALFLPDPLPVPLVVANALYFKGRWESEFDKGSTYKRRFWADGTRAVQTPMMQQTGDYQLARHATFAALEKDYEGQAFSMVVLLPKAPDGVAALEQECFAHDLTACLKGLAPAYVDVRLPRFRIETESMSFKPALEALGLSGLFVPGGESFGRITSDAAPVYLRDVVQKAFIIVDEQGTEAAAATVGMSGVGDIPPEPERFYVDHPFLFMIRDKVTGAVLFVGRVTEPQG